MPGWAAAGGGQPPPAAAGAAAPGDRAGDGLAGAAGALQAFPRRSRRPSTTHAKTQPQENPPRLEAGTPPAAAIHSRHQASHQTL